MKLDEQLFYFIENIILIIFFLICILHCFDILVLVFQNTFRKAGQILYLKYMKRCIWPSSGSNGHLKMNSGYKIYYK